MKNKSKIYKYYVKRILDVFFSLILILLLLPLLLLISLAVRLTQGKPIIFAQSRPGKNKKIFTLYKFRSMTNKKDSFGNFLPDEKRITNFGKLIRMLSLDELPELWNILKGDMSFVGPRPQLVKDMVFMNENQLKRFSVTPGLSGLAQVMGRNGLEWEKKLEYDVKYIEKMSFIFDLKIIFKTFFVVMKRNNVNEIGKASATDFGDYLLEKGKITQQEYITGIYYANNIIKGR